MKWLAVTLLALAVSAFAVEPLRYDGQKIIRVKVENNEQLDRLRKVLPDNVDIWSREGNLAVGWNDIRADGALQSAIAEVCPHIEVAIEDVQQLVQQERDRLNGRANNNAPGASWFDDYHRYADIVSYQKTLAQTYSNLITFIPSIGKSIEGRDIPALRINATNNGANTKRILWTGGQHAREWIGPATVLYITTQLVSLYGKDATVTSFLQQFEFDIVAQINPDGYEYTWTGDRLWRKNRRKNNAASYGVDLNRNWDDHWGGEGSSPIPSSDTYHGTAAFSEPETKATATWIQGLPNIWAGIDFHSYSQLVLRPYGWTTAPCPDETALKTIGDGVSSAIKTQSGKTYVSETSADLYIACGTASDWFYSHDIWGGYTIELRPPENDVRTGFVLPPDQIIPTGDEIWAAMKYFVAAVQKSHPSARSGVINA